MNDRIVIVGAGTAGVTAATTLRSRGYDGAVTVLAAEPGEPYRRTALTKDLLAADLSSDRIALQKPQSWAERDIDLRRGTSATAIDVDRHLVVCDDGSEIGYRALILATGARSARPTWLADDVAAVRSLPEALAVRSAVTEAGRLIVVGGGLIGLELAASAAEHGHAVDVVEAADRLSSRVLPEAVSDWLRGLHERHGATIRCGHAPAAVAADSVVLADEVRLDGPVVAAVGMTPNAEIAATAGIATAREGIVVDRTFATSAPDVFAAGDCAAVPDALTDLPALGGHWFGATDHGRAVAHAVIDHLDGASTEPFREVPRAWTVQYGVNVQIVGWPAHPGDVTIDGSLDDADATIRTSIDGGLIGAVTIGRAAAARACRAEIHDGLVSMV